MRQQNGNVLFLILIAVALFAALSYAVTQSTRGGGNADDETSAIAASNLIQLLGSYKVGIDRLRIKGCASTEISFFGAPGSYNNPNSPTDNSCHIFDPAGAGMSYVPPNEKSLNQAFSGETDFGLLSFERNTNIDMMYESSSYAVEATVPFVSEAVCLEINKKLHNISTIPENLDETPTKLGFTGNFSPGGYLRCHNTELDSFGCGHDLGCFEVDLGIWGSGTPTYVAYQLMMRE
jgi:hypothetical protein